MFHVYPVNLNKGVFGVTCIYSSLNWAPPYASSRKQDGNLAQRALKWILWGVQVQHQILLLWYCYHRRRLFCRSSSLQLRIQECGEYSCETYSQSCPRNTGICWSLFRQAEGNILFLAGWLLPQFHRDFWGLLKDVWDRIKIVFWASRLYWCGSVLPWLEILSKAFRHKITLIRSPINPTAERERERELS